MKKLEFTNDQLSEEQKNELIKENKIQNLNKEEADPGCNSDQLLFSIILFHHFESCR